MIVAHEQVKLLLENAILQNRIKDPAHLAIANGRRRDTKKSLPYKSCVWPHLAMSDI